ncbi:hypothetical protein NDU88_007241 [Pleurodeles waltl]|uniref:Uncharacterized protein n=1 Tax=Pleurodeles waltl TaxID=8319 RepID=A0AAV7UN97_PLEWA|nr:hypothetical protein NDU88_007241 [Pleurodeles waltl]
MAATTEGLYVGSVSSQPKILIGASRGAAGGRALSPRAPRFWRRTARAWREASSSRRLAGRVASETKDPWLSCRESKQGAGLPAQRPPGCSAPTRHGRVR